MDTRLHSPLSPDALVAVAGVAAAYGSGVSLVGDELSALSGYPEPVVLTMRLTYRVLLLGESEGLPAPFVSSEACAIVQSSEMFAKDALLALGVAGGYPPVEAEVADRFLDPVTAQSAGLHWTDLIFGAMSALRSTVTTVAQSPVGSPLAGMTLARAAALPLAR